MNGTPVRVLYVNHRGEEAVRTIVPTRFFHGSTEFYTTPQYLLDCFDVEKGAERTYRMAGIKAWGI